MTTSNNRRSKRTKPFNNKAQGGTKEEPAADDDIINLRRSFRFFLFGGLFALSPWLMNNLYPHGTAVTLPKSDHPSFLPIDYSNTSLMESSGKLKKIYTNNNLIKGPETVIFDRKGVLYVLTEESKLIKLTDFEEQDDGVRILAKATEVASLGLGRPLGGKFASDGTLYFADSVLGLSRVKIHNNSKYNKVELVASRVKLENGEWSPILYADDVDIGPKTGYVYFSDASDVYTDRIGPQEWETLHASKVHFMRGKKTGRLLRYDPKSDKVIILADNINFANGIAVDKDETFVMVSETFGSRILKYHIVGNKAGQIEVMIPELPSLPDGADCVYNTGLCYVPIPTGQVFLFKVLAVMPSIVEKFLRNVLLLLPPSLAPKPVKYGGVIEIFPGDDSSNGEKPAEIRRIFQDPLGIDIEFLTGVTEFNGNLYLGSLKNDFIGVLDLN